MSAGSEPLGRRHCTYPNTWTEFKILRLSPNVSLSEEVEYERFYRTGKLEDFKARDGNNSVRVVVKIKDVVS